MFERFLADLAGIPIGAVEADACQSVALDLALDPHENFGVHRLRAGIAAKQSPSDGREQKQTVGRDDQQQSEEDHVLRPQNHAEEVELPGGQIEQHGLTAIPLQPGQAVEQRLGEHHHEHPPVIEPTGDGAGVDFFANLVQPLFRG